MAEREEYEDLDVWLKKNGVVEPEVSKTLRENRINVRTIVNVGEAELRDLCKECGFSAIVRMKLMSAQKTLQKDMNAKAKTKKPKAKPATTNSKTKETEKKESTKTVQKAKKANTKTESTKTLKKTIKTPPPPNEHEYEEEEEREEREEEAEKKEEEKKEEEKKNWTKKIQKMKTQN
ncbi:hypothetical protein RFI_14886 [Reticulomyxa filosa]|uniref:Uncharacterized protein n=1 Tax=Reticulomyxa filosa TaxID=46433 RepID=X6N981_RETFI|nr:hypothetical protein RFI_14886 [Reticulomyxa filosa]|eukprot:ETO22314.1 hypothetical protein RFI_14886 [Reticulomyxa filosa]